MQMLKSFKSKLLKTVELLPLRRKSTLPSFLLFKSKLKPLEPHNVMPIQLQGINYS
jgi:hypothetical protein